MHIDDTNNSHQYYMIMGRELMQELGLDIKFSDYTIRSKSTGTFERWYTPINDLKEVIDNDLNNEIISDQIYNDKKVKNMTDRATHIPAANYHKAEPGSLCMYSSW